MHDVVPEHRERTAIVWTRWLDSSRAGRCIDQDEDDYGKMA